MVELGLKKMCRKIDYHYLLIVGIYGSKNLVVVFIKYIGKKMTKINQVCEQFECV